MTAVCASNSAASSAHHTARCPPPSLVFLPSVTWDCPYKILQIIVPIQLPVLASFPPQRKICALPKNPSFFHWRATNAIFLTPPPPRLGRAGLGGNVADMSRHVGDDTTCRSNFGQMGPCRRHKIEDVVAVCVSLSRHLPVFRNSYVEIYYGMGVHTHRYPTLISVMFWFCHVLAV